jgi:hypothetical protein
MGWEGVVCVDLVEDRVTSWAVENTVMNIRVP